MEFEEKRAHLAWQHNELMDAMRTMFPVGAPITWRLANSFNETGLVVGHDSRVRVRDDRHGFHTSIGLDDILRATP